MEREDYMSRQNMFFRAVFAINIILFSVAGISAQNSPLSIRSLIRGPEPVSGTSVHDQAPASTPTWTALGVLPGPEPSERAAGSAVLDSANNQMILFAGASGGDDILVATLNDVWVLSNANGIGNSSWALAIANGAQGSPPARGAHTAVYDAADNRMIIFGGCLTGDCPAPGLNDVWVLTNANGTGNPSWIQLAPTGGPPTARAYHAAVYDPGTNSMIVFAGFDIVSKQGLSDVWVLSNANGLGGAPNWTQLAPAGGPPQGQQGPTAVYDAANNIMTVFAGVSASNMQTNAVWTLSHANGQGGTPAWTNLVKDGAPGSPSKRAISSAVYDSAGNRMTIFGGVGSKFPFEVNDTWVLSNANGVGGNPQWTRLKPSGHLPGQRTFHSAVYDPASNRMIVFGGGNTDAVFYGTWVLTDANGQ